MTDTRWHYHARLDCGCNLRFDLADNVYLRQIEDDPEAEVVLHIRCDTHDRLAVTRTLAVTTADTPCHDCIVAGRRSRTGKVAPWKP